MEMAFEEPDAEILVDRLVHHAEVIALTGESYRLNGRGKEVIAATEAS